MTKEQAGYIIGNLKDCEEYDPCEIQEAKAMAIDALWSDNWIPVSERLPETNDDVLVTDGVDMFVAWYSRKNMWQGWMSSDNNFERNTPIDAWMPLPTPYEPQESEG